MRDEHLTAEGGLLGPEREAALEQRPRPESLGTVRRHGVTSLSILNPTAHGGPAPCRPRPRPHLPGLPAPPRADSARPPPPALCPPRRVHTPPSGPTCPRSPPRPVQTPPAGPHLPSLPTLCRPRPPAPPVRAPSSSSFPRIPPVHIGGPLSPASPQPMLKTPWSPASGHSSPADSTCPDASSRSSQERPAATEGL